VSERWRQDLSRLRYRRFIFWAVVASVLAHILFVIALFWMPAESLPFAAKEEPIWLDMSNLDAMPKPQGKVLTAPLPANDQTPQKSEHLAAQDNATEKETHRADVPINESMDAVGPRGKGSRSNSRIDSRYKMPEVGQGMASKIQGKNEGAGSDRGPDKTGTKTGVKSLDAMLSSSSFSTKPSGGGEGGGNYSPYNPNVGEPGNAINLNTRNFKYVGYFSGLKEKIEWAWVYPQESQMMGQQGMLTLSFTILRSGKLKEVKQLRGSGFPLLDNAARRAVMDAADFAPFPESWPDPEITIVANFSYQLIGAKSVF
jgi:TonB family protein